MHPSRLLLFVLALLLLSPFGCARKKVDLPAAPKGFSWYIAKNGVGSFLEPEDWYTREDTDKNVNLLFITLEKSKKDKGFAPGLTVKQITKASAIAGAKPSFHAQQLIAKMVAESKTIRSGVLQGGPTPRHVARVFGERNGVRTIAHHIAIGIDAKDMVFLISFEAPESQWQSLEPMAREMLNQFYLD